MKISEIKPGKVEFQGWIENLRDKKNMQFIVIRDLSGKIQVTVIKSEKPEIAEIFSHATLESTVKITGEAFANVFVKLGGMEILPDNVEITSVAEALPIAEDSSIDQRIDHRWVDLRSEKTSLLNFTHQNLLQQHQKVDQKFLKSNILMAKPILPKALNFINKWLCVVVLKMFLK